MMESKLKTPLELAKSLGMEVLDLLNFKEFPAEVANRIPYTFIKKNRVLPLHLEGDKLVAATSDPLNLEAIEALRLMVDREIKTVFCSESQILAAIGEHQYHSQKESAHAFLATMGEEKKNKEEGDTEAYDLLEIKEEAPIIRLLNLLLTEAIQQEASDIHFEPFENDLKIRYRIDGVLQTRPSPPREYQMQLLTRLKVLAKLDIAEHRLPQDGRIKLQMGGKEIDFRVSTVPVSYGERIVLRILDKNNVVLGLDQLGMLPQVVDSFRKLTTLSEGIILVTGPTGSGKTTTLYSALWELYDQESNIMTIEDPVEYKLKGIAQISVRPKIGLNFATGLRHILRQDPDIVMIGEIRDKETAEIAIQASLTGHLVLSTLHTNDAPSTLARLVDMGIEPYLLSSTIVGVLAQRLVRKVCSNCRIGYTPTTEELEEIAAPPTSRFLLYKGKGCQECYYSGYKGRHGLYELMNINRTICSQIAKETDSNKLRELAHSFGLISLREHGLHLVKAGITTLAEVLRVTRRYEL